MQFCCFSIVTGCSSGDGWGFNGKTVIWVIFTVSMLRVTCGERRNAASDVVTATIEIPLTRDHGLLTNFLLILFTNQAFTIYAIICKHL